MLLFSIILFIHFSLEIGFCIGVSYSVNRIQANSSITRLSIAKQTHSEWKTTATNTFRDTKLGSAACCSTTAASFHHQFFLIRYTRDIRLIDFCSFSASLQTLINTFYALFLSIQIQINILL